MGEWICDWTGGMPRSKACVARLGVIRALTQEEYEVISSF